MPSAHDTTGSITATTPASASTVTASVPTYAKSAYIQVSGTYAIGLVAVVEISLDGTNWFLTAFNRLDGATVGNVTGTLTATANGSHLLRVNVAAATAVRVRATGFGASGTASVLIRVTDTPTSN